MNKKTQAFPALTEQAVYEAIAYNPDSIAFASLAHLFGLHNGFQSDLNAHLNTLIAENKIRRLTKGTRFEAVNPMSDLVVATVIGKPIKGRAPLRLENTEFGLDMTATISEKQFNKSKLRPGEKILVLLERRNGDELSAKVHSRFRPNKTITLKGKFNAESGTFRERQIKTVFAVKGNLPTEINPAIVYSAKITPDFNPHKPEIIINDHKWDPETGTSITDIIANKHHIRSGHDRPTIREAKKISGKMHRMTEMKYAELHRRDLTDLDIFIVDPEGAADHDDGIMVERFPDGFRTLTVIADVPYAVHSGSLVDEIASSRGFSHYFPGETFHMLPTALGANSLSLLQGKLRPVIYVEQFLNLSGIPCYKDRIGLGYIRTKHQMTYGSFQEFMMFGGEATAPYRELQNVLSLRQYENEIQMESASTDHRHNEAQLLVQGLMVNANKALARFLEEKNVPFIYRTHSGPVNRIAYEEVSENFLRMGYELPDDVADLTPFYINGMIAQAEQRKEKSKISGKIQLELLQAALYSTQPLGHWGVSASRYGHFTSPIRRYCDIVNLRAVHTALYDDAYGLSEKERLNLDKIAANLNQQQIIVRNVHHDRIKYFAIQDLQRHEGNTMRAVLSQVNGRSVEIFLPVQGIKQSFPIDMLPGGWKALPNEKGIRQGVHEICKGDALKVTIGNVRPHRAQWGISAVKPMRGYYPSENTRKKPGTPMLIPAVA